MSKRKSQNETDEDPKYPFTLTFYLGVLSLAAVAAVGLALIVVFWPSKRGALALEGAKTLMQVIGVVALGAALSFAAGSLSSRFQATMAKQQRWHTRVEAEQQRWHTSVEAERVRVHGNWQRIVDMEKDARLRVDAVRTEMLEATIQSYNQVKRARRRLRVNAIVLGKKLNDEQADRERGAYFNELEQISDAQLQFERLAKVAILAEVDDSHVQDAKSKLENNQPRRTNLEEVFSACSGYLRKANFDKDPDIGPPKENGPLANFLMFRKDGDFDDFSKDVNTAVLALRFQLSETLELTKEDDARFAIDLNRAREEHRRLWDSDPARRTESDTKSDSEA